MRPHLAIGLAWLLAVGCGSGAGAKKADAHADMADERPDADAPDADARPPDAFDGSDAADATDVSDAAPDVNTTCAAAVVGPGMPHVHARLDSGVASTSAAACAGTGATLYYAVAVPSGHRLTAVVRGPEGDGGAWAPRIAALADCAAAACLARGGGAGGATQRLEWTNNAAAARTVILAVSADGPAAGGEIDLDVGVQDLFASCARPVAVQDGMTVANVDLQGVAPSTNLTCFLSKKPALYYVATLLPWQELAVTGTKDGQRFLPDIGLRTACDDDCNSSGGEGHLINKTDQTETVLIEVTTPQGAGSFDLHFSLPAPPAAIHVTPTSPLVTTEGGGKATFQVVLASRPTAGVTVALTSSRPGEGTVSPAALAFDATNWNKPQVATVTGANDQARDGAQGYAVVTAPATSGDPLYAGLDADDVPLTNLDDEPGVLIEGDRDVVTSEDGMQATFTVRLDSAPTADVSVPLVSGDPGEGTASPAALKFTAANWDVPQVVTVTGVDDAADDGPQAFAISIGPLVSADARFAGLKPADVVAHNRDDEFTAGTTPIDLGQEICGLSGTPNQPMVAMDALGTLYTVIQCGDEQRLQLFKSADGGTTVSGPQAIPVATGRPGRFAIAAGRAGTLYLAFEDGDRGLKLSRTEDGGATWRTVPVMPAVPDLIRIATARDTVMIVGDNPVGGELVYDGTIVLRSQDGGRSFLPPLALPGGQMTALALAPDAQSVWLVDDKPALFASLDAGASFQQLGPLDGPTLGCCFVAGARDMYAISAGEGSIARLLDAKPGVRIAGLGDGARAAAIDDQDVVTVVYEAMVVRDVFGKRSAGGASAATVRLPAADLAGVVALSRHATAIVGIAGQGLTFSVVKWP